MLGFLVAEFLLILLHTKRALLKSDCQWTAVVNRFDKLGEDRNIFLQQHEIKSVQEVFKELVDSAIDPDDKNALALLELNFLPTTGSKLTKQQLILARDILEIGAQWSILKKDIPSFERYMAQLKCYYFDYKDELPESTYKHQLLGLNLLFLLSQNRVAEFHTELERLPAKDIQTNVYIKHPVSLEQYLMEGSYNKVFLAKGNIPAESYAFFIDILLDTVRDEIASCIEKAYEKILFNEATRMLFFTPKKMTDYAKKRGWVLGPNNHYCFTGQQQKPEDATIPSTELAKQVIEYARQLEMIV
ncbi:hypothetical protein JD844_005900 [Phrynosoma platyrhinos]|uniref:26S proteasome non-ATPase regulatory subunit 8 n=1 Tax=Phrynosoma platyrhinos TaxID=52577 RepID=A0ABQ7TPH8_PHRPL|nr:hypothetical protein JD844_005900 [Phrynosoma platyrhinos]